MVTANLSPDATGVTVAACSKIDHLSPGDRIDLIGAALAVVLAIAIQVQFDMPLWGGVVRIGAADPVVLIFGLAFVTLLLRRNLAVNPTVVPGLLWWIAAMFAALAIALIVGRVHLGQWSQWAIANRFFGFGLLVAYFFVVAWSISLFGESWRQCWILTFVATLCVIAALETALIVSFGLGVRLPVWHSDWQAIGFMRNPNALAPLLLVGLCLNWAYAAAKRPLFSPFWSMTATTVLLAASYYTGSRAAWLAIGLVSIWALAVWKLRGHHIWLPTVIGACLILMPAAAQWIAYDALGVLSADTYNIPGPNLNHVGQPDAIWIDGSSVYRIEQAIQALRMWWEAPLLGRGLGVFLAWEVAQSDAPLVIHNSLLWLLAETGLAGTVAFVGFLFACLWSCWRRSTNNLDPICQAMIAIILSVGVMAMFHDLLYQRVLWLVLAIAVALPASQGRVRGSR